MKDAHFVFIGLVQTMDSLSAISTGSAANAVEMLILTRPHLVTACEALMAIRLIRIASTMPNALGPRVVQSATVNSVNSWWEMIHDDGREVR